MPVIKQRITEWEIVDLGIEHPDYFQGFGCSFTNFDNACYGIGNDPREAFDDACENMMHSGDYVGLGELYLDMLARYTDLDNKELVAANEIEPNSDTYYHIGIRWNAK